MKHVITISTSLLLWLTVFTAYSATTNSHIVELKAGKVQGFSQYGIEHFLGINYANAPVGQLRWQPPVPIETYDGLVQATSFGDMCMQPNASPDSTMSEDCLNLNIWTPSTNSAKLPVMVWLHGGGFKTGSNRVIGTTFAAKGAVVVALNYRLGPLGFFAHPKLQQPVANVAVLDMIAGLKWVKSNIDKFGGDADNITLFGVSAGGMAVNLMITNENADGLFDKAIAQSGYATWPLPRTQHVAQLAGSPDAEPMAEELVAKIATQKQTKDMLLALDSHALVNAAQGFILPIVDGTSVVEEPGIRFLQGQQNPVALITGGNSFEGSVMPYSGMSAKQYQDMLGEDYGELKSLYSPYASLPESLVMQLMWGENRYLLSAQVTAKAMDKVGKPSWMYYLDFVPQIYRGKTLGTTHGSDGQMLWGGQFSDNEEIQHVSRRLQDYWLNFAKNGQPTAAAKDKSSARWRNSAESEDAWLIISQQDKLAPNPVATRLNAFEKIYLNRVAPAL